MSRAARYSLRASGTIDASTSRWAWGIERGDAAMHRFHCQELQRAETSYAGGVLYFLQQALSCGLDSGRVAFESLCSRREQHCRIDVFGLPQSFRAMFGAEVSRG